MKKIQEAQIKHDEEEREKLKKIIQPFCEEEVLILLKEYLTREENDIIQANYCERFDKIEKSIDDMSDSVLKSERFRLRAEVLNFAEDLNNGLEKSSVAYQHIHSVYGRYIELGGNSYIMEVFRFITEHQQKNGR